jgi:hypothetical protein
MGSAGRARRFHALSDRLFFRVKDFAFLEHFHDARDPSVASFGLLRGPDPIRDRVEVGPVEGLEEGVGLLVLLQGRE